MKKIALFVLWCIAWSAVHTQGVLTLPDFIQEKQYGMSEQVPVLVA